MKTKTLLIGAAVLAAGVLSSQAQVYSQNVVGYVNVVLPSGQFALVSNPLDDGTNTVTSLGAALANKSTVQIWNGSGFTIASKGGGVWNTNLSIPVGTGFFVKSATAVTNTFVGSVAMGSTNSLPAGLFALVGSTVPYAGDLTDTNVNIGPTLPNKSTLQVWNGSGFTIASKGGGVWNTNLSLSVAQGFFVKSASAVDWVQPAPGQ
jgi:hypothetical protein